MAEPIRIAEADYRTERYRFSPTASVLLDLGKEDQPDLIASPLGLNELVVQARRCGDVYVEGSGPGICRSATAPDLRGALDALFAQVSA